jgi:hypothetical protein
VALSALALTVPAVRIVRADPPPPPLHAMPAEPPAPALVPAPPQAAEPPAERPVLLGLIQRGQVEKAEPDWLQAEAGSSPDPKAAHALAAVAPGATVTIYLGSWCGDSRRELGRFWRALDLAGDPSGSRLPFKISYVGVDRAKKEPAALVQGNDLLYVPTFVVQRDGREVGRIVESAPHGIEQDLLGLLDGTARGLLTDRAELRDAKPNP